MNDLLVRMCVVSAALDSVDVGADPEKARALLRRRKELAKKMEKNRTKGFSHRRRERGGNNGPSPQPAA
jgi:hypothetical protein